MKNNKVIGMLLAMLFAAATLRAGAVTIPAGTQVTIRMVETVDSQNSYAGETLLCREERKLSGDW